MAEKSMPELQMRRYQPGDWDQIWELHVTPLQQIGVYKGEGPWDDDLYSIDEVYFQQRGDFLVGILDGRLVAMGAFRQTTPTSAEIKRMRTQPDMQGQGLGGIMIRELEQRARQLGYIHLHLETSTLQIGAHKFYRKYGFREVGRTIIDGYDSILFEKEI